MLARLAYVIVRQSALFGLPLFRRVRNIVYAIYLNTEDINVDDFVRIHAAHASPTNGVKVGKGLRVSRNAELDTTGGLWVGERVTISEGALVFTHDHPIDGANVDWRLNAISHSPLRIEDDAWIGSHAIVLSSVSRVGRGAIIAAGAVVRENVPDFAVVAGIPAKVVRLRKLDADLEAGREDAAA